MIFEITKMVKCLQRFTLQNKTTCNVEGICHVWKTNFWKAYWRKKLTHFVGKIHMLKIWIDIVAITNLENGRYLYLIGTICVIEGIEVLKICFIFLLNHRKYVLALNSYTSKCLFLHHIQMRRKVTAKIRLFGKFANQLCQVLSQIDPVQRIWNHVRIIFLLVIFFFIKTSIGTQKSGQFWKKGEIN